MFDLFILTAIYIVSIIIAWLYGYIRGRSVGREEVYRMFNQHRGQRRWT